MKRIGLTECGPSTTPKPSAIRDENRCLITGTEYIGQLRDVYVIPPNFVPSIAHESPEGGEEVSFANPKTQTLELANTDQSCKLLGLLARIETGHSLYHGHLRPRHK